MQELLQLQAKNMKENTDSLRMNALSINKLNFDVKKLSETVITNKQAANDESIKDDKRTEELGKNLKSLADVINKNIKVAMAKGGGETLGKQVTDIKRPEASGLRKVLFGENAKKTTEELGKESWGRKVGLGSASAGISGFLDKREEKKALVKEKSAFVDNAMKYDPNTYRTASLPSQGEEGARAKAAKQFDDIKAKEKELASIQTKINSAKSAGYNPLAKDVKARDTAAGELAKTDPRLAKDFTQQPVKEMSEDQMEADRQKKDSDSQSSTKQDTLIKSQSELGKTLTESLAIQKESLEVLKEIAESGGGGLLGKIGSMITGAVTTVAAGGAAAAATGAAAAGGGLAATAGTALTMAAPAAILAAPFVAAGMKKREIEANPNAEEFKDNPYAMTVRGEAGTIKEAGASNSRKAMKQASRKEIEDIVASDFSDEELKQEYGADREGLQKWLKENPDKSARFQMGVPSVGAKALSKAADTGYGGETYSADNTGSADEGTGPTSTSSKTSATLSGPNADAIKAQMNGGGKTGDAAFDVPAGMKVTSDTTENIPGGKRRKQTSTGMSIANEMVVPGQPLSDKQMAIIKHAMSMGNKYPKEIMDQYESQKSEWEVRSKAEHEAREAKLTPEQKQQRYENLKKIGMDEPEDDPNHPSNKPKVTPTPTAPEVAPTVTPTPSLAPSTSGDEITSRNADIANSKAEESTGGNTVINAPTTNNSSGGSGVDPSTMKSPIRNPESSVDRYIANRYGG
jgi:hypothetical protein